MKKKKIGEDSPVSVCAIDHINVALAKMIDQF